MCTGTRKRDDGLLEWNDGLLEWNEHPPAEVQESIGKYFAVRLEDGGTGAPWNHGGCAPGPRWRVLYVEANRPRQDIDRGYRAGRAQDAGVSGA